MSPPGSASRPSTSPATSHRTLNQPTVTVYYFHRTLRCPTCLRIEELARDVLQHQFADEQATGTVIWRMINIEKPENVHFEKDFDLKAQSLVIIENHSWSAAKVVRHDQNLGSHGQSGRLHAVCPEGNSKTTGFESGSSPVTWIARTNQHEQCIENRHRYCTALLVSAVFALKQRERSAIRMADKAAGSATTTSSRPAAGPAHPSAYPDSWTWVQANASPAS